ncbi:HDIG domain-containing protein [Candidatus Woesearchaeota archaeon]|nr:HDIG domain-containing protein [Candidatus Woesearchaeota archaeon]
MNEQDCIRILKKHSSSENAFDNVLHHAKLVQELAMEVARRIEVNGTPVDKEFIRTATILHDIGRFRHPPGKDDILHGIAGAEILRQEGIDERYARVCERHLGAGIPKEDIVERQLPLPEKDFVPESVEEKIITYADVLHYGAERLTPEQAIKRFTERIGPDAGERVKALHDNIQRLMGNDNKEK